MITNVVRETAAESVTYGYDSLDRLTSANAPYLTASYGWDLAGNPTTRTENSTNITYTLGTGNKLTAWTGGSYGHDSAGCVTNITRGSDMLSLEWNSRYQLTAVSTNGTVAEAYTYGPFGRRASISDGTTTNWLVYSGRHVVAELDATGSVRKSFTWGGGQQLLAWTDHTGPSPVMYYPLSDSMGTVHAVADATGSIVENYRFDAFGALLGVYDSSGTPIDESSIGNHYLFHGKWFSWTTRLYFNEARWYDPQTARFLSRDPSGIVGGFNLFQFCRSNPVNYIDEDGEFAKEGHAYWMEVATGGHDMAMEGGFWGKVGGYSQAAGASIMTSFIDFWGARSLQNNAELSGEYSGEGCTGKALKHGGLAVGQIALSATAAFGGNNAAHPWYRYVGPKSLSTYTASGRVASGAWVVRGRALGRAPFGRNFVRAKDALQLPFMPDDVIQVKGAWKQFIHKRGRATGFPKFGTGGAHQWQVH